MPLLPRPGRPPGRGAEAVVKRPEPLLRASLMAIAASLVIALVGLWRVTAVTSLVLFMVGTPLLVLGLAGYGVVVFLDLRKHGVL